MRGASEVAAPDADAADVEFAAAAERDGLLASS